MKKVILPIIIAGGRIREVSYEEKDCYEIF